MEQSAPRQVAESAVSLPEPQPEEDRRILVISQVGYAERKGGGRARMRALLEELRGLGYEIHFAGIRMGEEERDSTRPHVDRWVADFVYPSRTLPAGLAAAIKRMAMINLHRLRAKLREPFRRRFWVQDRLDQEFLPHWLAEARALQQRGRYPRVMLTSVMFSKFFAAFPDPCVRILDTIDLLSNRRLRQRAQGIETFARSLAPAQERRGLLRANRIVAIQAREAEAFRQLVGTGAKVYLVGHFADLPEAPPPVVMQPRVGCIAAINAFNTQALEWFLREVWPRVRTELPTAEAWLAGGVSTGLAAAPGLKILGHISSLDKFYCECPVFINPVQAGTGLKIKTIEALMHGRSVLTTSIGAEGLDEFIDHGLVLANEPAEFAAALVRLLKDLPATQRLGESALPVARSYLVRNRQTLAKVMKI